MKKIMIWILVLLLVVGIFVPALAQVSQHFDLRWHLLSGGGGPRSSAHFQIDDVLGQWPDGRTSSAHFQIDPGFWHAGQVTRGWYLYLPVAYR